MSLDYLTGKTELELDEKALQRMQDISKMSNDDRTFIFRAIDALIRDLKAQRTYAS